MISVLLSEETLPVRSQCARLRPFGCVAASLNACFYKPVRSQASLLVLLRFGVDFHPTGVGEDLLSYRLMRPVLPDKSFFLTASVQSKVCKTCQMNLFCILRMKWFAYLQA